VTLFDRAVRRLRVESVRVLSVDEPLVADAAEFLGLR
jgi:hypothetical protein